jgi:hypothetical protein
LPPHQHRRRQGAQARWQASTLVIARGAGVQVTQHLVDDAHPGILTMATSAAS